MPSTIELKVSLENLTFVGIGKKVPVQIEDNIIIESNVAIMGLPLPLPFVFVAIFRAGSVFRRLV